MAKTVTVVGGGIVGVCAALEAQKAGFDVTLIDRKKPGRETSFGNAGVLSESSVVVLNNPGLLKALPQLLKNKSVGFRYSPWLVLKKIGWFIKFLSYCTPQRSRHAAHALRALMAISLARHKTLIKEAGVDHLLRYQGWLKIFRKQSSFEKFKAEMNIMDDAGVRYTVYDESQIRQLEPGLQPIYTHAVLLDDTCGVSNPAKLTDAYVELFEAAGGKVIMDSITDLKPDKGWNVALKSGNIIHTDYIVLAAGAWSAEIASWLDYDIPMLWERGYHRHLEPAQSPALKRAIHDVDGGFVMAPMQTGVRITTGVEMRDRDAPEHYEQLDAAIADARKHHGFGEPVDDQPWMGRRPTIVDSLPMLGKAPRHEGLYFNFGHQHIGLSMGPGSAQVITALLQNQTPPIDISPFTPDRFNI